MTTPLKIFTSAAVNYLPKVRVLCTSIRKFHPEASIYLMLPDEQPDWLKVENEPFDHILPFKDLDIPNKKRWCFTHSIVELSTAVKPFALASLLDDAEPTNVLYFDPDMVLFSRVDDILERLDDANLVLTPHQNKPELTVETIRDNELSSLRHGIFNLGFIGVRNTTEGKRFAKWWSDRTYLFCRAEVEKGLFTDQKWIDFAPVFFDGVEILKSSRHNVATWNLTTRHLEGSFEKGFTVDEEALAFYHFTGFDSGAHQVMAEKHATENKALQSLISWYKKEITPAKNDPINSYPWAFGQYDDGTPIEFVHRWFYRESPDLHDEFPDPFNTKSDSMTYLEWIRSEGVTSYPDLFKPNAKFKPGDIKQLPLPTRITLKSALRLGTQMLYPSRGASLRARLNGLIKREGISGILRRIS